MNRLTKCDRVNKVAQALLDHGWVVVSRKNHVKLRSPDGRQQTSVSVTPSDWRTCRNWLSDLRREGVDLTKILPPACKKCRDKRVPVQ